MRADKETFIPERTGDTILFQISTEEFNNLQNVEKEKQHGIGMESHPNISSMSTLFDPFSPNLLSPPSLPQHEDIFFSTFTDIPSKQVNPFQSPYFNSAISSDLSYREPSNDMSSLISPNVFPLPDKDFDDDEVRIFVLFFFKENLYLIFFIKI